MAPPLLDTFHGGETVTGDGLRALFSLLRVESCSPRFFRLSGGAAERYIRGWVLFEMVIRKGEGE